MEPDGTEALRFHAATKYRALPSGSGVTEYAMGTPPELEPPIWQEDWSIEPRPYKVYPTLEPIPLPAELLRTRMPALEALARNGDEPGAGTLTLAALAHIGRLSNGLLNRRIVTSNGRRVVEFRTAGGTGARYHLELYFVCADLPDLPAGVYHYATQDHSLRQLRSGDFRGTLAEATGREKSVAEAPVTLALTSTFWRNAWRYRARAYRHTFWDAGTMLANTLGVAASLEVPARVVLGYEDAAVNALLGVDGEREATIALCALGSNAPVPAPEPLEPISHPTEPVSRAEVTFAAIPRMHAASALRSTEEVARWRAAVLRRTPAVAEGPITPLKTAAQIPSISMEDLILARRSSRRYDTQKNMTFEAFSTVLDRSARAFSADCLASGGPPLHDNYLIVEAVEHLAPGVYLHRGTEGSVELLKAGEFRREAEHLAFDQWYVADAHVNSYYLTELGPVLDAYGDRGYRLAQLEAALYAGRLHLAAEALGLGACGSTSFDDEVVDFFSPRAREASFMFISVFGVRRARRMEP